MFNTISFDTHENLKELKAAGFTEDQLVTRQHLDERLRELEYRLIIRLGGMIVVAIGVVATLVKIL